MVGPALPDLPPLSDLLRALRESRVSTRIEAARLLGHTNDPAAIDALIATLHSTELPSLRKTAAHALERIGAPAITALITALGHPDDGIQGYAVYVLKLLGTIAITPLI